MSSYTISFYNDMGHLLTKPEYSKLPSEIYRFACEKIRNKFENIEEKEEDEVKNAL